MSVVAGYYNTINKIFLGAMHTPEGATPRYMAGICWGNYNTVDDTFVPLTNPMIQTGKIIEFDEDIATGKTVIRGMVEDKGSELKFKGNVISLKQPDRVSRIKISPLTNSEPVVEFSEVSEQVVLKKEQKPKKIKTEIKYQKLDVSNVTIDLNKLFG